MLAGRYEVRKSDPTGNAVVLDSDADIDPLWLARAGSRIYWLHGGVSRTAILG